MKPAPEKLIPQHGGYRKLKSFQLAQLAVPESRTLAALRDALLPKLLSGELRVPGNLPASSVALPPHEKNSKKQERIDDHQT